MNTSTFSYAPSRPWFRALVVAMVALFVLAGSAEAVTTLNADIDTDGDLTADGLVQLGDGDFFVSMDAGGAASMDMGEGNIFVYGTGVASNIVLSAGNLAPTAGEDGNDVALEAEDDVLVEVLGSFIVDAGEGGTPDVSIGLDAMTVETGTSLFVNSLLDANGTVSLGDSGDTVAIDSSDWDITTTGTMTGIGSVSMDGNLTLGSTGAPVERIGGTVLSDGSFGWTPDGATTTFTITAPAANITANSHITVAVGANATATVCGVSTSTVATSFVVVCTAAPDNGATLSFMITNFVGA